MSDEKLFAWLDLKSVICDEINSLGDENYVHVCSKNGKYQGVCIWFTVEFPDGSELSTAPSAELTHWKQTVLLLTQEIEVCEDEAVAYNLKITKDKHNCTRYNFELTMLDAEEVEHDIPCQCYLTKCIVTRAYLEKELKTEIIR